MVLVERDKVHRRHLPCILGGVRRVAITVTRGIAMAELAGARTACLRGALTAGGSGLLRSCLSVAALKACVGATAIRDAKQ
jgi:hypothetical protein